MATPGSVQVSGSQAFEIKLVHAPADGVAPAVLFSIEPLQKGPEVGAGHLASMLDSDVLACAFGIQTMHCLHADSE